MSRHWAKSRFDDGGEDPAASLVNLVDIMLVFICALIVALVAANPDSFHSRKSRSQEITRGRELERLPEGMGEGMQGSGMQPLGQVYRDPKTGKLILVGEPVGAGSDAASSAN